MAQRKQTKAGVVEIHGREYKTVALRMSEFRSDHPITEGWGVVTQVVTDDDGMICVRAEIVHPEHGIVATGLAEEKRGSSQINKTSAMENCETSAIGRALAAAGYGGDEYASANEVQNAVHQQQQPEIEPDGITRVTAKFLRDYHALCAMRFDSISDDDVLAQAVRNEVAETATALGFEDAMTMDQMVALGKAVRDQFEETAKAEDAA